MALSPDGFTLYAAHSAGGAVNTGTAFAAAIGYFDPSAASPSLQSPAAMGGWQTLLSLPPMSSQLRHRG